MRPKSLFALWLTLTMGIGAYLAFGIAGKDKSIFLPGATSDGHYQIEASCGSCHTPFGGVRQEACLNCHAAELAAADDSHPEKKFTDPRNADRVAKLDARKCIVCHVEHRPEVTGAMGVSLPADYCYECHAAVAEERPTHKGMAFDTCAAAGCHNFHDNRALYADFLVRHGLDEPDTAGAGALPARAARAVLDFAERLPLTAADADGPAPSDSARSDSAPSDPATVDAWAASAHASGGVACTDCHRPGGAPWADKPPREVCRDCHKAEFQGFAAGKHGMRFSVGLPAMSPSEARLPMRRDSFSKTLDCSSCHDAHAVDTRRAAVDACLSCHADDHSNAYRGSPHFYLWQSEISGEGKPGSGVSCASCHLPRETRRLSGGERVFVQHNQNANLRPNEKMLRDVCLSCHGLAFSIDALADPESIGRNFSGRPSRHVPSIDMSLSRTN